MKQCISYRVVKIAILLVFLISVVFIFNSLSLSLTLEEFNEMVNDMNISNEELVDTGNEWLEASIASDKADRDYEIAVFLYGSSCDGGNSNACAAIDKAKRNKDEAKRKEQEKRDALNEANKKATEEQKKVEANVDQAKMLAGIFEAGSYIEFAAGLMYSAITTAYLNFGSTILSFDLQDMSVAANPLQSTINRMPEIISIDVNNDDDVRLGENIIVTAKIQGSVQREVKYDHVEVCLTYWNFCSGKIVDKEKEQTIFGNNPAKIKSAVLYYMIQEKTDNGFITRQNIFDEDRVFKVRMEYNKGYDQWTAKIQSQELEELEVEPEDRILFAIVATDETGAVLTEDLSPFNERLITNEKSYLPLRRFTCPFMNYEICNDIYSGRLEPDDNDNLLHFTQDDINKVDMRGISIKADSDYLDIILEFRGDLPGASNPKFFNYDVVIDTNQDSNPDDYYLENTYVAHYSPQMPGVDAMMVRNLISGACLNDPTKIYTIYESMYFKYGPRVNFDSEFNCRLVSAVGADERLRITSEGSKLTFSIKRTGIGNPFRINYDVAPTGDDVKPITIMAVSLVRNAGGGVKYDTIAGINYYHRAHVIDIKKGVPPSPIVKGTACNINIIDNLLRSKRDINYASCSNYELPTDVDTDQCYFSWQQQGTGATKFNIYKSNFPDASVGQLELIASETESIFYIDSGLTRNGKAHYYFISSVNECGETGVPKCGSSDPPNRTKWAMATCMTNFTPMDQLVCEPCVGATCP